MHCSRANYEKPNQIRKEKLRRNLKKKMLEYNRNDAEDGGGVTEPREIDAYTHTHKL